MNEAKAATQIACVEQTRVPLMSPEEKKEKLLELKKELIDKQNYTIELNKKIAKLEGISIDNTPLTAVEKEKISQLKERRKKAKSHLSHKAVHSTGDRFDLVQAGVCDATGSPDLGFGLSIIGRCVQASSVGKNDNDEFHYDSIVNALNSLKPQDEIEGMLISRMISLHFQSMHYLACAANNESSTQARELNINRSVKLSRLYNESLDALSKYRRKGAQQFIVQHLQLNDNSKAIVGGVFDGEGGGKQ